MVLAPPEPGQERIMSFREELKLRAYQETIDYIKKRIRVLETGDRFMEEEDTARLETYREVLNLLEYGGGLARI
jgi:hypothetical protein